MCQHKDLSSNPRSHKHKQKPSMEVRICNPSTGKVETQIPEVPWPTSLGNPMNSRTMRLMLYLIYLALGNPNNLFHNYVSDNISFFNIRYWTKGLASLFCLKKHCGQLLRKAYTHMYTHACAHTCASKSTYTYTHIHTYTHPEASNITGNWSSLITLLI